MVMISGQDAPLILCSVSLVSGIHGFGERMQGPHEVGLMFWCCSRPRTITMNITHSPFFFSLFFFSYRSMLPRPLPASIFDLVIGPFLSNGRSFLGGEILFFFFLVFGFSILTRGRTFSKF